MPRSRLPDGTRPQPLRAALAPVTADDERSSSAHQQSTDNFREMAAKQQGLAIPSVRKGRLMSTFMVGYDLNKPAQNYEDLIAALKSYSRWWHYLDSTWLVVANSNAVAVRDHLKQFVDSNDELLVIDVSGDHAAWWGFEQNASEWLRANL